MSLPLGITSLLFVPATRPERFAKAIGTRAGLVVIDLEDSVPADAKDTGRAAALGALGDARVAVRINGLRTRAGMADLLALAERPVATVLVPMVESAAEVAIVRAVLGEGVVIVPLVETVRGIEAAGEIASSAGVAAMMFGGGDLSAELGVELAWEPLAVARGRFVMACAGAGVPAIDVPWVDITDADGLAEEARRAHSIGFAAKAAIHPAQVDVIDAAFRPSDAQLAEARAAEAAYATGGGAAVAFGGRMLEAPLMARYRRMLATGGHNNA